MSCQIRLTATIQDINGIKRCLFPTDDQRGSDSWLQLCEVSASPTGDIIAIANERKIVILTSKWDSQSNLSQFHITFSGTIHSYDKIKSIVCLPVVGENEKRYIGPDWTCILVAFDSGYVRFYTENCELLIQEQFHNENITTVKCQSQHSPRPDILPDLRPEEIYVQYQSSICVINGPQLFSYLRNCRNLLARGQVDLDNCQAAIGPKKWGFSDQSVINDSVVVGLNLTSTFDHLLTASTYGGFDTRYRATAPNSTLVLAAGSKPFLGYHYALEGGAQPVLSDVAKVVANKLKSALPGWLTGSKTEVEKQMSLAMQPADVMGCRFGLCDLRRTATSIILSPNRKLAAVCDTLGRVLLIDTFRGIVLRIFKGYRDAQCSFIQEPDEKKSKHRLGNKVAHFLVIYSPKKGTIEVFSLLRSSRICTFTASKYSRLLYINYGLMGFTTMSKSRYICQFTSVLMDNDGQIKEIMVPYHFALTEKNNKRARDIHLYKKLRHLIKSGEFDEESLFNEAYNTCSELKTTEFKTQVVEILTTNRNISAKVILQCTQYFIDNTADEDAIALKTVCENLGKLLRLYCFVTEINHLDQKNGNSGEHVESTLNSDNKNMKCLQKLLDLSVINDTSQLPEVHVSFSDNISYTISEFLSCFDISQPEQISLKNNVDGNVLFRTAEVLFKPYITGLLASFDELQTQITESAITTENLFDLLITYWVNRSFYINLNLEKEMENLSNLIYILVLSADKTQVATEYNEVSEFWSKIREILADSYRPFPALTAAIMCKNVAHRIDSEMDDSAGSFEVEGMEILSKENVQWSILVGKLEDVSLLNIILSTKPIVNDCPLPKLKHDNVNISLKYILEHGRGSVSELMAQWLTSTGINPQNIVINENLQKPSQTEEANESTVFDEDILKDEKVFEQLNLLRSQFPYSLDSSVLLSNMTWEYASAWQKDIQDLGHLEAAITCISFIQNIGLKQGLYQLLWNTHLKIMNESACKLINKVGKLPKERLCKQDTGLSDCQISLFIGITTDFFDKFMYVAQQNCGSTEITLQFENIWDNGSQSLVELAAQHKQVNYDLLHLHYQLSVVLQMITTFSVKHMKPVNNLFEPSVVNLLFTDFRRKIEINWNKSDIKINSSRIQFLLKVIDASMESVKDNQSGTLYSTEHVSWMSKCLMLARFWNLDLDILRRYQVMRLYTNGFDSLAEELMAAVNDRNEMGSLLLVIASKRLSQFLATSPTLGKNLSALTPSLTKYMDTLDNDWCAPTTLSKITTLAMHILTYLSEDDSKYKLAELLLDGLKTLEEIHS